MSQAKRGVLIITSVPAFSRSTRLPRTGLNIVVVGGGSAYTGELLTGLLADGALPVERVLLLDVPAGRSKVEAMAAFGQRLAARAGRGAAVDSALGGDAPHPFAGADFVLMQYRVGGLAARALDEHVPLRHGVVGQETVGPGGFAKALRTVPVAVEMAERIRAEAPTAWLLNFTNPSGLITEAITAVAGPRVMGLCNGPYITRRLVAEGLGVDVSRVALDVVGLNHLSFARVFLDGADVTPAALGGAGALDPTWASRPEVPSNQYGPALAQALGRVPSAYLRYYWQPDEMLAEQQADVASGRGTRADFLMRLEPALFRHYRDAEQVDLPPGLSERGGAFYSTVAVELMRALAQNQPVESVVNVPNGSVLPELEASAVIEVSALVDGRGARPLAVGPLPAAAAGLVQQVKAYERLTIKAALAGSHSLALAALLSNPLVPSRKVAERLLADLLEAHATYLPRFRGAS